MTSPKEGFFGWDVSCFDLRFAVFRAEFFVFNMM